MLVSFNGFGESIATFEAAGAAAGAPVKMSGNGAVSACAAGDTFCGIAIVPNGSCASVQLGGYVKVTYSGTAPTVGYNTLAADGSNGVKTVTTGGRQYLVLDIDTASKTAGIIL